MIELQNISKSFDGVLVLDNISAEIPDSKRKYYKNCNA